MSSARSGLAGSAALAMKLRLHNSTRADEIGVVIVVFTKEFEATSVEDIQWEVESRMSESTVGSPTEHEFLGVKQTPQDVFQFSAAVQCGVDCREKLFAFGPRRRAGESGPEKLFKDFLCGFTSGQQAADTVFLFGKELIHSGTTDHLKYLAHVAFARTLGV